MDVIGTIGAVNGALEVLKTLRDISKTSDDAAYKLAIAEITTLLADAKIGLAEHKEMVASLNSRIKDLETMAEFENALIEVWGFKYDEVDGKPTGYPYCPTCEVKEGKYYRLSRIDNEISTCLNCKNFHNAAQNGRVNLDGADNSDD